MEKAENKNKSQNLLRINEKLMAALSSCRTLLPDIATEDCF
jgi:hypothetical protein